VRRETPLRVTRANNAGISPATSEVVTLLDDGALFLFEWRRDIKAAAICGNALTRSDGSATLVRDGIPR